MSALHNFLALEGNSGALHRGLMSSFALKGLMVQYEPVIARLALSEVLAGLVGAAADAPLLEDPKGAPIGEPCLLTFEERLQREGFAKFS